MGQSASLPRPRKLSVWLCPACVLTSGRGLHPNSPPTQHGHQVPTCLLSQHPASTRRLQLHSVEGGPCSGGGQSAPASGPGPEGQAEGRTSVVEAGCAQGCLSLDTPLRSHPWQRFPYSEQKLAGPPGNPAKVKEGPEYQQQGEAPIARPLPEKGRGE